MANPSSDLQISGQDTLVTCAFKVCTLFDRANKTIVLTGGSAATVYSRGAYMSSDIDFVLTYWGEARDQAKELIELGFQPGQTYRHELLPFTLDFIQDELAVGSKSIREWSSLVQDNLVLHILSPTDCVLDRLAGAIHWEDFSAIDQAVLVAQSQIVDIDEVQKWCHSENPTRGKSVFDRFQYLYSMSED